jgi:hypothetical protein
MIDPSIKMSLADYSVSIEVWSKTVVGSDKFLGMSTFPCEQIQQAPFSRHVRRKSLFIFTMRIVALSLLAISIL